MKIEILESLNFFKIGLWGVSVSTNKTRRENLQTVRGDPTTP